MRATISQRIPGRVALVGVGAVAGAFAALLESHRGRRARRAHPPSEASRALREQLYGIVPHAAAREALPDELIAEHLRRQLDRPYLSHPGLVDVHVYRGRVLLSGAVLQAEVEDLVQRLAHVQGVRSFDSHLHVAETEEELAGHQVEEPASEARGARLLRLLRWPSLALWPART